MRDELKNSDLSHNLGPEKKLRYKFLCFLFALYLLVHPQLAVAQDASPPGELDAVQLQNDADFQAFLDTLIYKSYLPAIRFECNPDKLLPSEILYLKTWKLFLPVDYDGNGDADIVLWPALKNFVQSGIFQSGTNKLCENFVRLIVRKGDNATTPGSSNPRAELREMQGNGVDDAAWDARVGIHRLVLQFAVKELGLDAEGKEIPVVVAQVHGPSSDVLQIRLRKENGLLELVAHYDDANGFKQNFVLVSDYKLGEKVEVDVLAKEEQINGVKAGVIKVTAFARGVEVKHDIVLVFSGSLYFQAGNYTQGLIATGASEVQIYKLDINH